MALLLLSRKGVVIRNATQSRRHTCLDILDDDDGVVYVCKLRDTTKAEDPHGVESKRAVVVTARPPDPFSLALAFLG